MRNIIIVAVCLLSSLGLFFISPDILSNTFIEYGEIDPFSRKINLESKIQSNNRKSLSIRVAQGEFESMSFYIKSKNDISDLNISSSDFSNKDSTIESKFLDIKYVKYWYQAGGAWSSHRIDRRKKSILVPELLINDQELIKVDKYKKINYIKTKNNGYVHITGKKTKKRKSIEKYIINDTLTLQPVSIKKNIAEQFFVTVYISNKTKPGVYEGEIILDSVKIEVAIPVKIEVLPFKLEPPNLIYSLYYRGKLHYGKRLISSELKTENQLKVELKDMVNHGVCCPTMYQKVFRGVKNDNIPRNISLFERYLDIRESSGVANSMLFYLGLLTGGESSLNDLPGHRQKVNKIISLSKKYGVKDVFFYGKEEKRSHEYDEQKPAWDIVRQQGGKVFVAIDDRYFMKAQNSIADISVYHDDITKENSLKVHKLGSKILSYSNPQVGVENPQIYRENYGFNLLRNDFDGVMTYAYQDSMGLIWNDFDHPNYRDLAFTYPTSDGVVGTVAWEAFREAVDDVRYYQTYKKIFDEQLVCQLNNKFLNPDEILGRAVSPDQVRNVFIKEIMRNIKYISAKKPACLKK